MRKQRKKLGSERGHSVIEVALMAPWIFFIFMAVIDIGFFCYAAINTQNAARAVAMYASSVDTIDTTIACSYALRELSTLPVTGGNLTTCSVSGPSNNTLQLLIAPASPSPDGMPASQVTVTVRTLPMIPIPGLMSQLTISRTSIMRVNTGT